MEDRIQIIGSLGKALAIEMQVRWRRRLYLADDILHLFARITSDQPGLGMVLRLKNTSVFHNMLPAVY